jgi:hypothetical protein
MSGKFQLSLFQHKRDTKPQIKSVAWQQLCASFQNPKVRYEKDGLLFSPALFEPAYRKKENVTELSLLCFDVDHDADFEHTKGAFDLLGCVFAIYSTHSHLRQTDKNPNAESRYRVVIPLVCPIPASNFPKLWQYAKQHTKMPFDESAKDESRMYYTPVKASKSAPYEFYIKPGEFLDWRKLSLDDFADGDTAFDAKNAKNANGNGRNGHFEFHEDRHAELCRLIEQQGKNTGRGTFEMKCKAHNGNGDSSLFYDVESNAVSCLKNPKCSYQEILKAFRLPTDKLPSREQAEKQAAEFEATETKVRPFPVPNEKMFHGLAGEFVRMTAPNTESDPTGLLIQFLTFFGNIIGRSAHYKVEAAKHFTNLYCVLVGDTASGRKGTSLGHVKEIFRGLDDNHDKNCIVGGLASGEGLIYHIRDEVWELKPEKKTKQAEMICTDFGVSDKRLLVTEGEFAQVLRVQGRESSTLSAVIRNLWDTGTARNLTKNSPLRTTDALVSIIGHITTTELLSCLTEVESANGYANRFLWFSVQRSKFLPFGGDGLDFYRVEEFKARLKKSIEFARTVERMLFTEKARNLFKEVYPKLETSRYGFLAKVTQRASAYVCRLSCIFALLDGKDEIDLEHLEAALAVWQYSEDSARYIFGERLGDKNADIILKALSKAENGLTRTEIRNLFERHIENGKLNSALQTLLKNGLARFEKEQTDGRPKEIWFACVLSDKSVLSPENLTDEQPYNAFNAKNASEEKNIQKEVCPECESYLSLFKDNELFCEVCLYTRKI